MGKEGSRESVPAYKRKHGFCICGRSGATSTLMDSRTIFRFCPRCGKPAIAHEGKHAIRCSACNFLFFFNAATAVGAIIPDKDGRLLFLRRAKEPAKGKLGMPGGFVDRGEMWKRL